MVLKKRNHAVAEDAAEGAAAPSAAAEGQPKRKKLRQSSAAGADSVAMDAATHGGATDAADEATAPAGPKRKVVKKKRMLSTATVEAPEAKAEASSDEAEEGEEKAEPAAEGKAPSKKAMRRRTKRATIQKNLEEKKGADGSGEEKEASDDDMMVTVTERTVFVDGVPYTWKPEKIKGIFGKCGRVVHVKAPTWNDSGRLRGYAHVIFADRKGQQEALQKMNGIMVAAKGRYLKVEQAKGPLEERNEASQPEVDMASLKHKRRLFVKNLPYRASEQDIKAIFAAHGKVVDVRIPTAFGRTKGFAYVEFADSESLAKAIKAGAQLEGRRLQLDADSCDTGPKAGFHYRAEAFLGSTQAGRGRGGDKGKGKGKGKGKSKGKGGGKGKSAPLQLFE